MNLLKRLQSAFTKPKPKTTSRASTAEPRQEPPQPKTEKELATEQGQPYVSILSFELDPANLHQGAFELDWNDKFVANLVRAGYQMKPDDTDAEIVDRWFQNVCRHVVMETWEQEQAMNPTRWTQTRDIGGGRKEVS